MTRKNVIIAAVVAVILVAGGVIGYWQYTVHSTKNFITYQDPHFTDQETELVQNQIKTAEEKVASLANSGDAKDKYKASIQVGLLYSELGMFTEAKTAYAKALTFVKDDPTVYHELFVVENSMRDYKSAKKDIEKAIALNDQKPQYWNDRITLMFQHFGSTNEEIKALYEEALKKTNNATDVLTSYARFLETISDLAGSVEKWKAAIIQNPNAKDAYQQEIERIQSKVK